MTETVFVVVRAQAAGSAVHVEPPPSTNLPSAAWMAKLAALWRPMGAHDANAYRCCIPGSLEEVLAHLWRHQTLWLRLAASPSASGAHDARGQRHVAVRLCEVLDESMDTSAGRVTSSIDLEDDDAAGADGRLKVSLNAEVVRSAGATPKAALRPSLDVRFVLRLVAVGAPRAAKRDDFLQVSLGGVEQPLGRVQERTLVLVDQWSEVQQALYEMDAHIRDPSTDDVFSLDLSPLVASAGAGTVRVATPSLPRLGGEPLVFEASVRALPALGAATLAKAMPEAGPARGRRAWRVSVELQSVKLSAFAAQVFVAYTHPPFLQKRPFKTSAAVAPLNVTVQLPHAFGSYALAATLPELQVRLEEPLCLELWRCDAFESDELIGAGTLALGPVLDEPLQRSARMPSMLHGFRVVDQLVQVFAHTHGEKPLGLVRVLCFLEDLGLAKKTGRGAAAAASFAAVAAAAADPRLPPASRPALPLPAPPATGAGCTASPPLAASAGCEAVGVDRGLARLRGSPAYEAAYELELWKQGELDKLKLQLAEQERTLRASLEEEYREMELRRAKEFRVAQAELRDLEQRLQRRLAGLQERDLAVKAAEEQALTAAAALERRAQMQCQELEARSARDAAHAEQDLEHAAEAEGHSCQRIQELEALAATARQEARDVETALGQSRRAFRDELGTSLGTAQQELLLLRAELREERGKADLLAASRDHFCQKAQELCRRLLVPAGAGSEPPAAVVPAGPGDAAAAAAEWLPEAPSDFATATFGRSPGLELLPPGSLSDSEAAAVAAAERAGVGSTDWDAAGADAGGDGDAAAALDWLRAERDDLMQSGVYSESDAVIAALDAKISEVLRR